MKQKRLFRTVSLTVLLFLTCVGGLLAWVKWQYSLPTDESVRQQFVAHRAEYIELASLLASDQSVLGKHIGNDGEVSIDGVHKRFVSAYRERIHQIGAEFVLVREDGSIEFALWGSGCTLCFDSYKGVRYFPNVRKINSNSGWPQRVVDSLESEKLPQENGSVASGLYVVSIETEWFVYRLDIQE